MELCSLRGRGHLLARRGAAFIMQAPDTLRMPEPEKESEGAERDNCRQYIDEPGPVKVGYKKLWHSEANARHENSGPDLEHAAKPSKSPNQPEGNDDGKERQLSSYHGAQLFQIKAGHALQADDWRSECPESYWCRIGDEGKTGSRKWREAQTDQECSRDCDGSAETGSAFKKCAETECHQQEFQS